VKIYPPANNRLNKKLGDSLIKINNKESGFTDTLIIDFIKDSFRREHGPPFDPSYDLIYRTVCNFLLKFRTVSKQAHIIPVLGIKHGWELEYLNDDGSKLKKQDGKHRTRWSRGSDRLFTAINKEIWDDIEKLDSYYQPPIWETLLFDAKALMPQIGPPIVLAHSSLEVFIPITLDILVEKSQIPPSIWKWINNRKNKNPDIREQYDSLLNIILGKSLKSEKELWQALNNLTKARNSFVHNGIARIDRKIVNSSDVSNFINKTEEIIKYVDAKLPEDIQWYNKYNHSTRFQFHNSENS